MNKFNIGDIIVPIPPEKGDTWIVLDIRYHHTSYNLSLRISYYLLSSMEAGDQEILPCEHIDKLYERA